MCCVPIFLELIGSESAFLFLNDIELDPTFLKKATVCTCYRLLLLPYKLGFFPAWTI
jgi:hypothetical protein